MTTPSEYQHPRRAVVPARARAERTRRRRALRRLATVGALIATTAVASLTIASGDEPVEAIAGAVPGPFQVALTFDDGPGAATPAILDILAARGVPATFFVVGAAVDNVAGHEIVRRMHREGHSVQNHTYRHPFLTQIPDQAIRNEIAATSRAVERLIGVPTTCFRPPYGATSARVRANALGHTEVMWTADTNDYQRRGVASIVANALIGADGRGMNVLMHDGGGSRQQTIAALPLIIDAYIARGYEFVNLCRDDPRPEAEPSGLGPPPIVTADAVVGVEPVAPVRVLDSRLVGGRIAAGTSTPISLPRSLAADATAVIAQITAAEPTEPGWLTSHRCGSGPPGTSSLNVDPRIPARAGTTVAPVVDGQICIYTSTETHVLVDVTAAFVPGRGLRFRPDPPTRLLDTRLVGPPTPGGSSQSVRLPDRDAVLVNVTATDTDDAGFVTAWPCDPPRPDTSLVNQMPELRAVATATILPTGSDGSLCIDAEGTTALIVDLIASAHPETDHHSSDGHSTDDDDDDDDGDGDGDGEHTQAGNFRRVEPVRLLDTRLGVGGWTGYLLPGTRIEVATAMPPGVLALVTVTATDSNGPGYLVVWDGSDPVPSTSTINHDRLDVANLAGIEVGADGSFVIVADGGGSTHLVIDLHGWFEPD